jgi:hypothetical protein
LLVVEVCDAQVIGNEGMPKFVDEFEQLFVLVVLRSSFNDGRKEEVNQYIAVVAGERTCFVYTPIPNSARDLKTTCELGPREFV